MNNYLQEDPMAAGNLEQEKIVRCKQDKLDSVVLHKMTSRDGFLRSSWKLRLPTSRPALPSPNHIIITPIQLHYPPYFSVLKSSYIYF